MKNYFKTKLSLSTWAYGLNNQIRRIFLIAIALKLIFLSHAQ